MNKQKEESPRWIITFRKIKLFDRLANMNSGFIAIISMNYILTMLSKNSGEKNGHN